MGSVGERMKERPRGELVGLPEESVFVGIGPDGEAEDEERVEGVVDSASVVEVQEGD